MNVRQIALIYFYLISAGALTLIVVGIFAIATLLINTTQYTVYPLRYMQEDCDANYRYPKMIDAPTPTETLSKEELQHLKEQCEQRIAMERKKQQLDDIKNAIVFPLVGLILFAIHFPLALKQTKQK